MIVGKPPNCRHPSGAHAADRDAARVEFRTLGQGIDDVIDLAAHLHDHVECPVGLLERFVVAFAVAGQVECAGAEPRPDPPEVPAGIDLLGDGPPVHPDDEGNRLGGFLIGVGQQGGNAGERGPVGPSAKGGRKLSGEIWHTLPAMIRIVAGEFRTRRLESPPDAEVTRPYTNKVREAVFNRLRGWFEDALVLDLFAGVGSMGLEAASRGAAEVLMVERDRGIAALAQRNIDALGCGDRVRLSTADVLGPSVLDRAPRPLDVVFVDPPYAMMRDEVERARITELLTQLAPLCARQSLIVLRTPLDPERVDHSVPGLHGPEAHRYGPAMWVLLYEPADTIDDGTGADAPESE